ncbi:hypothetical protein niasHT_029077 [Heterodera trifolii]|uniref:Pantoate--beta-alanine ligase n=1 Tax=Heterodera trifolii TaxID=157864 RepID=A0ABD2KRT6_9BILA
MSTSSKLTVINTIATMRQFVREHRKQNANLCVALVPTMGALHQGHLRLAHQARLCHDDKKEQNGTTDQCPSPPLVIVSIFVNPLQFGANEDYERYPRTLEADLAKLEGVADCAFVPNAVEMFGEEKQPLNHTDEEDGIGIKSGRIGRIVEGVTRPQYHDGMLLHTVKLYNIVQPNLAFFGKKDAQQLFAIEKMTAFMNFPVRVVPVDTEREPDGLAMSSRNQFLSAEERRQALCLYNMLVAARNAATHGAGLASVAAQAQQMLTQAEKQDGIKTDYFAVVDPDTFSPLEGDKMEQFKGKALLLVAVFVGRIRLIDNMEVLISG